ncbi:MAG: portal protein [Desulfovibrionales bacterium]
MMDMKQLGSLLRSERESKGIPLEELIRKTKLHPAQAARAFGLENLPPRIRQDALDGKRGLKDFWHAITLNDRMAPGGPNGDRFRAISRTVCEEGPTVIREGGYYEMPAYAPRFDVDALDRTVGFERFEEVDRRRLRDVERSSEFARGYHWPLTRFDHVVHRVDVDRWLALTRP